MTTTSSVCTSHKIVLDPGHSGPIEPGACAAGVSEAALVLEIARRTERLLQQAGHEVRLTRDGDIDNNDLSWRAQLANRWGADLFLSIHTNSFSGPAAHGTEVWHYPGSADGIHLAGVVQEAITRDLHTADRGIKPGRFTVLAATDCPAVLVETAFLSNAVDRVLLTTPQFQELIAAAIAAGVHNYYIT